MTNRIKIRRAAEAIRAGGIVAYPTEAVYGLGCDPANHRAVQRILALKRRLEAAGLIIIAADLEQLADWIDPDATEARRLREPGALVTWVVTAGPATPIWITGGRPTVAVRVTRHPVAAALCRAAHTPIVSTSANRSGCAPARSERAVRIAFGTTIDHVLTGPTGSAEQPSEIRLARSGAVLRPGPANAEPDTGV